MAQPEENGDEVRGKRRPALHAKTHTTPLQKVARPECVPDEELLGLGRMKIDEQHENKEMSELKETVKTLRRQVDRLHSVVDRKEKTIADLKYEKAKLQRQLDVVAPELERLQRELTDNEEDQNSTNDELAEFALELRRQLYTKSKLEKIQSSTLGQKKCVQCARFGPRWRGKVPG